MGVISWTVGQALGQALGVISWTVGTGTVGVISSTVGQALWVLLAPQWDRHCGCY